MSGIDDVSKPIISAKRPVVVSAADPTRARAPEGPSSSKDSGHYVRNKTKLEQIEKKKI